MTAAPQRIGTARRGWRGPGGICAAACGRGLAAACLMLAACSALEEAGRPSLDTVATRMPANIAGFTLGEVGQRPGPALALDYATPNRSAVATVLVYNTGGRAAPTDPASPEFERELSSTVAEVTEAPSGRTGRRLTEQRRVTVADPGLRCAVMSGAFGRAPVTRHVCVGSAQGRFVKVQVTMGSGATRESADAMAFAAEAVRAVRG